MSSCRICKKKLSKLIDFGNQFVSNFTKFKDLTKIDRSSLKLGICSSCKLVQLFKTYNQKKMYRKYWYISGVNEVMIDELGSIVKDCLNFINIKKGDAVLDIASNDGTLLSNYSKDISCIGIDPSDIARKSKKYRRNLKLINNFFDKKYFKKFKGKFKIVTNVAMFYDSDNPSKFLKDLKFVLANDGIGLIQISYTPLMLKCNEFGVISHEHVCYYTFETLNKLLKKCGLKVFDVKLNDSNGASIRVFFTHSNAKLENFIPLNKIFIGDQNISAIKEYEKKMKFNEIKYYKNFVEKINSLKIKTLRWLKLQSRLNKIVIGYGASTKGNVLLQYYKIDNQLIKYIAERSKIKFGLYTPGSKIKIISENHARKLKPDYLFILPWFFTKSIIDREHKLIKNGAKIICPQPDLTEISLDKKGSIARKILS